MIDFDTADDSFPLSSIESSASSTIINSECGGERQVGMTYRP
jgi:hypothetical protein